MPSTEATLMQSCTLGKPQWIDPQLAQDAAAELIRTRGPMRRVWAMVEVEGAA
jgi:hypothetical protein